MIFSVGFGPPSTSPSGLGLHLSLNIEACKTIKRYHTNTKTNTLNLKLHSVLFSAPFLWKSSTQSKRCWPQMVFDHMGWARIIPNSSILRWLNLNKIWELLLHPQPEERKPAALLFFEKLGMKLCLTFASDSAHLVCFSWKQEWYLHLHPTLQKEFPC